MRPRLNAVAVACFSWARCALRLAAHDGIPARGYDKASAIAHKVHNEGVTLKEAALQTGVIDERRFDAVVDPKKMAGFAKTNLFR